MPGFEVEQAGPTALTHYFVNWFHAWAISGAWLDNRIFQHTSPHLPNLLGGVQPESGEAFPCLTGCALSRHWLGGCGAERSRTALESSLLAPLASYGDTEPESHHHAGSSQSHLSVSWGLGKHHSSWFLCQTPSGPTGEPTEFRTPNSSKASSSPSRLNLVEEHSLEKLWE